MIAKSKGEMEDCDDKDQLYLKKLEVTDFDSGFQDETDNVEWLSKVPQHLLTD